MDEDDDRFALALKNQLRVAREQGLSQVKYSELSRAEVRAARMTMAAYVNFNEGIDASRRYVARSIEGWTIDEELTTKRAVVFAKNGRVHIAYRGTSKASDWLTNLNIAIGSEEEVVRPLEAQYARVIEKYGEGSVTRFTGHSKGGGEAILMGDRHGVDTITQDPALSPRMLARSGANHTIVRTPTDWVSGLTPIASSRFTQKLIEPVKGTGLLASHDLEIMTAFDYESQQSNPLLELAGKQVDKVTAPIGEAMHSVVNRSTLTGVLAGYGAAEGLDALGADNDVVTTVSGGIGNVAAEYMNRIRGRPSTGFASAFVSGSIAAEAALNVQGATYGILRNGGLSDDEATIISSGVGGGAAGLVEYHTSAALAYAERRLGRGIMSAAAKEAIAAGVERFGLQEVVSTIGGRVFMGASRGRWGGFWGAVAGTALGLAIGVVQVATHHDEKLLRRLAPGTSKRNDAMIANNEEIKRILEALDANGDVQSAINAINSVVSGMRRAGEIPRDYFYQADLVEIPEHAVSGSMIEGVYTTPPPRPPPPPLTHLRAPPPPMHTPQPRPPPPPRGRRRSDRR